MYYELLDPSGMSNSLFLVLMFGVYVLCVFCVFVNAIRMKTCSPLMTFMGVSCGVVGVWRLASIVD